MSIAEAWLTNPSIRFRIRALKARFRDARAELGVIRRHVRPGDIVCDVGANQGSFIFWLSAWVGEGRVVAFEPQPGLAVALGEVCRAVRLDNVTVEAQAVFSRSGEQELFMPIGHQPGASLNAHVVQGERFTTLTVPTIALDDYFKAGDRITLLKIDVEGAELDVLKGAERILRQHAPLLVFECENRHLASGRVEDVFAWLGRFGYQGSFIRHHRLVPLAQFDAARHQRAAGELFWKSRDYCNNFVFRKVGLA